MRPNDENMLHVNPLPRVLTNNLSVCSHFLLLMAAGLVAPAFAAEELEDSEELDESEALVDTKAMPATPNDSPGITVTVASKNAEKLQDASATVTVYSNQQIEDLGYYTLAELANITASYSTFTNLGNTRFETRGQSDSFNSKHLLLIDGIPVNHARDYMVFSQEQLPLQFAEQVEFLRGPASALYGTSAFSGVVNIRSKTLADPGSESELMLSLGDTNSEKRMMGNFLQTTEDGQANFSFSFFQKDPSLAEIPVVGAQRNFLRDDSTSIFGKAGYRFTNELAGLSVGIIYMSKETGYGEAWNQGLDTSEVNQESRDVMIPYIKYETNITENLKFKSYAKYNRSTEAGTQSNDVDGTPFFSEFSVVTNNVEYLAETQWTIDEDSNFITGVNLDIRGQDDENSYRFNPDEPGNGDTPFYGERAKITSFYAQYSRTFDSVLSGLLFTAGARYDEGEVEENTYKQVSPKFALVQRVTDYLNLKLLWGGALKVPTIKEVGVNVVNQSTLIDANNTPNIDPETSETIEFAAIYTASNATYTLTLFDTMTDNQIIEQPLDAGLYTDPNGELFGFFQNIEGETTSTGVEFDVRAAISPEFLLFANVSTADTEDPDGNELANVPKTKINIGGTYDFGEVKIGAALRHVNEYSTDSVVSAYDGQVLLDANVRYSLAKNLDLELRVKNLGDENFFQANNGLDGIPQPGREALVSVRLSL